MQSETYDFVVIGSGSGGGALAGRLSENGKYTVLCMEAGTKGADYIWSRPPAGVVYMIDNPLVNWRYSSEAGASHGSRPIYVPRGKLLGGSSAINATVYNRGQAIDYDTWASQGCRGWSYKDVLPLFKRIESTEIGTDPYRGRTGPVRVSQAQKIAPFYDLFIQAANSAGIPFNPDYSGASQEGVAMAQYTAHRGMRHSSATQYLKPARRRKNLSVLQGAEATSLVLEGSRCVGVRFRRNGVDEEVRAAREVIVACGTVNTPKLLELSGIGDPEVLRQFGIPLRHELPGVGANLREHFGAIMSWKLNQPGISLTQKGRGWRLGLEILRYVFFRKGFISQGHGSMRVFARSRDELKEPDIMMVVSPYIVELKNGKGRKMSKTEGFFMYTHVQRTQSTGSIHIQSADPFAAPSIKLNFLDTESDRATAILAVRRAREIVAAQPLQAYVVEEMEPGQHVQTDEQILDYIRRTGGITQHMLGTCKMGHDAMAVVDDRLRVHGIAGLRIADASIMPTMISGNTSVPCMMVGEKCADMVLEDAARSKAPQAGVREPAEPRMEALAQA